MKTNLIFKRQVTNNGVTQVVTKIVPVDIPHINSGEGWILSGHTDVIEIMNTSEYNVDNITDQEVEEIPNQVKPVEDNTASVVGDKFISDVPGTAKLVRSKGVIKIVARRGKSTYNQTTPNSVCIDDLTKNNFFKDCRSCHGNIGYFQFTMKDVTHYDYWNNIIDKEYMRQKNKYIAQVSKNA